MRLRFFVAPFLPVILCAQTPCLALTPSQEEDALGKQLCSKHQENRAIPHFDRAIQLDRQNIDAFNDRGAAYLKLDEFDRAIEDLNIVLKARKDSQAYKIRSLAWSSLGNIDKALTDMTASLDCAMDDGTRVDRLIKRVDLYRSKKQNKLALADLDEAIKLSKAKRSDCYYQRGRIYTTLGDYDRAAKAYTEAIDALKPTDLRKARYYALRADVYEKLGKKDLADADRKQLLYESNDNYGSP